MGDRIRSIADAHVSVVGIEEEASSLAPVRLEPLDQLGCDLSELGNRRASTLVGATQERACKGCELAVLALQDVGSATEAGRPRDQVGEHAVGGFGQVDVLADEIGEVLRSRHQPPTIISAQHHLDL